MASFSDAVEVERNIVDPYPYKVQLLLTYGRKSLTRAQKRKLQDLKLQDFKWAEFTGDIEDEDEKIEDESPITPDYALKLGGYIDEQLFPHQNSQLWSPHLLYANKNVQDEVSNPVNMDADFEKNCVLLNICNKYNICIGALEFHRSCILHQRHVKSLSTTEDCDTHEHAIVVCLRFQSEHGGSRPIIESIPVPRTWTADSLFRVMSFLQEIQGHYDYKRWVVFTLSPSLCFDIIANTVPFLPSDRQSRVDMFKSILHKFNKSMDVCVA